MFLDKSIFCFFETSKFFKLTVAVCEAAAVLLLVSSLHSPPKNVRRWTEEIQFRIIGMYFDWVTIFFFSPPSLPIAPHTSLIQEKTA